MIRTYGLTHIALAVRDSLKIRTTDVEENIGSIRVLEKCGFARVGTTVEHWERQSKPVRLAIFSRTR